MHNNENKLSPYDAVQLKLAAGLYAYGLNSMDQAKQKIMSRCKAPETVWAMFPDAVEQYDREFANRFINYTEKEAA